MEMYCVNVKYYRVCVRGKDPDFSPDSQKCLGDELGSPVGRNEGFLCSTASEMSYEPQTLTSDFRIPVLLQCHYVYTSQSISPESPTSSCEIECSLLIKEL